MEIRNTPQSNGKSPFLGEQRLDITKSNRQGIEEALEHISQSRDVRSQDIAAEVARVSKVQEDRNEQTRVIQEEIRAEAGQAVNGSDKVEFSSAGQILAGQPSAETDGSEQTERSERLAELKSAFEAGELNTPERVERAAEKILGI